MGKKVMFVDDEPHIRKAIKRLFMYTDYDVLTASSGKEALQLLKNNEVDMLITDIRMPEMNGELLLKNIKALYPWVIRVAISGYTDKKMALSLLDKNLAKIYLFKPWENKEILEMIERLFKFEEEIGNELLVGEIKKLDNMPTLPQLYNMISVMILEEESVAHIGQLIETDPAIASRILRIANSAYYGGKTGDINQAIMFIGLVNVKNIILSNSIFSGINADVNEMEKIFNHSALTNKFFGSIYKNLISEALPNEFQSAGLLHNIGRGVLLMNSTTKNHNYQGTDIVKGEKVSFGISHDKLGGYLLNWWELPFPIVEAALYHHDPFNPNIINKKLLWVIHLAQHYAWEVLDITPEGELNDKVFEALEIEKNEIEKVILEY